jgi:GTPase SAR1 family protein
MQYSPRKVSSFWSRRLDELVLHLLQLAKLLVGNKLDLEASREVSKEKAHAFCQQYGMELLETSAKSGTNVLTAFEKLIDIVHDRADSRYWRIKW